MSYVPGLVDQPCDANLLGMECHWKVSVSSADEIHMGLWQRVDNSPADINLRPAEKGAWMGRGLNATELTM